MGKIKVALTILVFSLVFQHGIAVVGKCSVSPDNTVIYFDLEQLEQLALEQEYGDEIYSPSFCKGVNDIECVTQPCCHDEVGCCYTDPINQVQKCGCKQAGSKTCTYPAILAILANSKCDTDKKTEASVCLRAKRSDEENHISTRNTTLQSYTEGNRISTDLILAVGDVISSVVGKLRYKTSSAATGVIDQTDKCRLPAIRSLIYLDLEQLSLITLHQGSIDIIQSPQACIEENGGDCSKQQCCHGEVGCCFTDDNKHIRKCGCKKPEDETCTYPAPLAILATSDCESEQIVNATACLRERRGDEESFISIHDMERPTESKFIIVPYSKISGLFSVITSLVLSAIG